MKMMKLLCVCFMALSVSSGYAAMRFGKMPARPVPEIKKSEELVKTSNNALKQAMIIHNLMVDIPMLEELGRSLKFVEKNVNKLDKAMKNFKKCGEKAFGGKFKNSSDILDKAIEEYKTETQKMEDEYKAKEDKNAIMPLYLLKQSQVAESKQKIGRGVFRNIANNPQKYGAEFVDDNAKKSPSFVNEDEKPTMNILDAIVQSDTSLHNATLSRQAVAKAHQEMVDQFKARLKKVGLEYQDLDFSSSGGLARVRADLKKLKEAEVKKAEEHIARLDAQDAQHPELVAKRTYRSSNKQKTLDRFKSEFPDMMEGMVLMRQMSPQRQQEMIIEALKKDANGTVYLTETNVVELDRKMKELEAHKDLMDHFLGDIDDKAISDVPEFDFSQCKA